MQKTPIRPMRDRREEMTDGRNAICSAGIRIGGIRVDAGSCRP